MGIHLGMNAQTIRIMPLGNSITWDENSLDATNPRSDAVRISYRYKLFQLMNAAGYDFDYVGSENCGNNYFGDPEFDDNAGFPGIETWQLEDLINTGYNAMIGSNESPGPYLDYYPAEIILLHIGTNALIESAYQVENLLDRIRSYDPDVLILVARIINRRTYHASTTIFNNNVELMVTGRADPRIKMVNMETGADINYSEDMIDNLHPNPIGYDKMAYKWFEAIQNLNAAPVITPIPEQFTSRETDFAPINLDDNVVDNEDPAELMTWTFTRKLGSQLNVTIDANRILRVSPNGTWYGSELLTLKAEDTGSGAFPASHSINVKFTVTKGNDPPTIESSPTTIINQEENYSYTIQAYDVDSDPITFTAVQKPSWLSFNEETHQLSGTPHDANVGTHDITLRVSDPTEFTDQIFQLEVINLNDPPVFSSVPQIEVDQGTLYSYVITAVDPDGDPLQYSVLELPAWLQFNSGTRVISGTSGFQDVGEHDITIQVNDGTVDVIQSYQLTVINTNDPPEFMSAAVTEVYEDGNYYYNVIAHDDNGDNLTYSAPQIPGWLTFDPFSRTLIGQPVNEQVGSYSIVVRVSDGYESTDQDFELTVINVNDLPVFTTEPLTDARALEAYVYRMEAEDIDPDDVLTFTTVVKPEWLTLVNGSNDALLFGTPTEDHIGSHAVIIQVSDGTEAQMQGFTLIVSWPTSINDADSGFDLNVYPNPAHQVVNFKFEKPGSIILHIYNAVGMLKKTITSDFEDQLEVNISDFERGIYYYKAIVNGREENGKFIKN